MPLIGTPRRVYFAKQLGARASEPLFRVVRIGESG